MFMKDRMPKRIFQKIQEGRNKGEKPELDGWARLNKISKKSGTVDRITRKEKWEERDECLATIIPRYHLAITIIQTIPNSSRDGKGV